MLVRQTIIYGIARLLPGLSGLALISFLTQIMEPEGVGRYILVTTSVWAAQSLTLIWFNVSVGRFLQRAIENEGDEEGLLGTAMSMFWIFQIVAIVATLTAAQFVSNTDDRTLLYYGLAYFVAASWVELAIQVLSARLQAARRLAYSATRTVISTGLGATLAYLGWGPQGLLIGFVVGNVLVGLGLYIADWRHVRFSWSRETLIEICKFGLPFAFSFCMGAIAMSTDRYMVAGMTGVATLGLFVVGYELALKIVQSFMDPVGIAGLPIAVKAMEKDGAEAARAQVNRSLTLLLAIGAPVTLGLVAVTPDFVELVVGEEFREMTLAVLPVIAVYTFFMQIQRHYVDYAFHLGMKTGWHSAVGIAVVVANVIFNYLLITRMGAVGAAFGTLAASLVGITVGIILGRRSFVLPFPVKTVVLLVLANAAMVGGVSLVDLIALEGAWLRLVVKAVTGAVIYAACMIAMDLIGLRSLLWSKVGSKLAARFNRSAAVPVEAGAAPEGLAKEGARRAES